MSTYPSVVSTISNPQATDKLSSPSHSSIESSQNDAISKLETFIGTLSSTQGTLMYDIRATASDGGGHIQSANKGGTGQTSYAKGDTLVATSSSVLSKLTVGSNNQVLTADSTQAGGVKWAGVANATDMQNQTYTYARASVHSSSVYGVVLAQAVSILSDGLGLVVKFPTANATSIVALTVNATGPSSLTALVKNTSLNNLSVGEIRSSMIGILEFDSVSSVFQMVSDKLNSPFKEGGATNANSNIASTSNVNILSTNLNITAGDLIKVKVNGLILNNSGGNRSYTFKVIIGSKEGILTQGTVIGASATDKSVVDVEGVIAVSASNLTNISITALNTAQLADGTTGVHGNYSQGVWTTSTSDFTGSQTITFAILSDSNTTTQTFTLLGYSIEQIT